MVTFVVAAVIFVVVVVNSGIFVLVVAIVVDVLIVNAAGCCNLVTICPIPIKLNFIEFLDLLRDRVYFLDLSFHDVTSPHQTIYKL